MPKRSQGQGDKPPRLSEHHTYRCFIVKIAQQPATHWQEVEANRNIINLCGLVNSDGRFPEAIVTHDN